MPPQQWFHDYFGFFISMSNKKISALTSATTPLAGTEEVPIVQSGATVKTTVADITGAGAYPGYFTTLTSTGNTTLGDATTDTVQVNGYMSVGGAPTATYVLRTRGNITGGTTAYGIGSTSTVQSGVTSNAIGIFSGTGTAAASFTVNSLRQIQAGEGTKGVGSTVTDHHGLYVSDLTLGTNNYGITSLVTSGSNKWNIYASGTADNYFAGNVGVGIATPGAKLDINESTNTSLPILITARGGNALTAQHRYLTKNSGGANTGGAVGFNSTYGLVLTASATSIDTARDLIIDTNGNALVIGGGGLGYGTGSGGTVTQITSRTTGVTLNKTNGAITLVSAAGSVLFQSFTVTNSKVAATDVVHVTQKSGTDLYQIFVTATAAGSFRITFATTGGVTVEQPVFNFAVIKAVTA